MMKGIVLLLIFVLHSEANGLNYTFKGCFKDDYDEHVLHWWLTSPWQSPSSCADACSKNRFRVFGMAGGRGDECFCGNSGYDQLGVSDKCTTCSRLDGDYICATPRFEAYIAVYEMDTGHPVTDERYIGCWNATTPAQMVDLEPQQVGDGKQLNISECIMECRQNQTKYVGIMDAGSRCYCGSDLQKDGGERQPVPTENCSQLCSDGEPCGGGNNSISLYRAVCPRKTYGTFCLPCRCRDDDDCNPETGVCPSSCAVGWTVPEPNAPCSEKYTLGLYSSLQDPDTNKSLWQVNKNLAVWVDGDLDTCLSSESVSSMPWWLLWRLEQPEKIVVVVITYKNVRDCGDYKLPQIAARWDQPNYNYCDEVGDCGSSGKLLLRPEEMQIDSVCAYTRLGRAKMFSDAIEILIPGGVTICEIRVA